jgi:hypothetical protein
LRSSRKIKICNDNKRNRRLFRKIIPVINPRINGKIRINLFLIPSSKNNMENIKNNPAIEWTMYTGTFITSTQNILTGSERAMIRK